MRALFYIFSCSLILLGSFFSFPQPENKKRYYYFLLKLSLCFLVLISLTLSFSNKNMKNPRMNKYYSGIYKIYFKFSNRSSVPHQEINVVYTVNNLKLKLYCSSLFNSQNIYSLSHYLSLSLSNSLFFLFFFSLFSLSYLLEQITLKRTLDMGRNICK